MIFKEKELKLITIYFLYIYMRFYMKKTSFHLSTIQ